ncbi:MAG: helix-turn-helix domain-containing protein [Chloroflexi bacterium]|nr:helix-turn-helix domain-containing protein [Chloroflexota bacterium]
MGDLGQLLREARQQKGVSLEEVEEATRIRQKFLQALEEGNFAALPAEAYVKGFLRTYAMYLELDPDEVMALYQGREDEGKAALRQPGFFQPMDLSMAAPSWLTPDLVIGGLLIVALLAFGSWAAWHYLPPPIKTQLLSWRVPATATPSPTATISVVSPPATSTATPTTVPAATPTDIPTATPTPLPTVAAVVEPTSTPTSVPTRTPTGVPTNTPTPGVSAGVEVELRIVEYAWMRVIVDGEEVFVGSLEAGTTRTWRGRESVALRCGNAGGVEAIVNGQPLGLLGERGQVVDVEWFAEGVIPTPEVIAPTVTPTASS